MASSGRRTPNGVTRSSGASSWVRAELNRVDWSDAVSDAFGRTKAVLERRGDRVEDMDAAIAAHAAAHDATLLRANVDDMQRIPGVTIEDWSRPPG